MNADADVTKAAGAVREFTAFFPCGGSGGAALGFQQADFEARDQKGRFRVVGGIDVDDAACKDFLNLTGVSQLCADLFSYDQYVAFHSKCEAVTDPALVSGLESRRDHVGLVVQEFTPENRSDTRRCYRKCGEKWWQVVRRVDPPNGWQEVTAESILAAAGGECPDVVFSSPPCKGFSGLLPRSAAESPKYQALNQLVIRTMVLVLEAFTKLTGKRPRLWMLENVPRIVQRGAELLREVKAVLGHYGYLYTEGYHDCGQIGHMAQTRKRYLLIARDPQQLGSFVYEPDKYPLRTIGQEIGPLPIPGNPAGGPMHRLPKLSLVTWLRLALIPAGGDWRDLEATHRQLLAGELQIIQDPESRVYYLVRGDEIRKDSEQQSGTPSDWPVIPIGYTPHKGTLGVNPWNQPSGTVIANNKVRGSGISALADARVQNPARDGFLRIGSMDGPSSTVTGHTGVSRSNAMGAIADDRVIQSVLQPGLRTEHSHPHKYAVCAPGDPYPTVTGSRLGSGQVAFADKRVLTRVPLPPAPKGVRHDSKYKVQRMRDAARTVDGTHKGVGSGQACVADDRVNLQLPLGCAPRSGAMQVLRWENPSTTVTGAGDVHAQGAAAVADRRTEHYKNSYRIQPWHQPAGTVTSGWAPSNGGPVVADQRLHAAALRPATHNPQSRQATLFDQHPLAAVGIPDVKAAVNSVADPRWTPAAIRAHCGDFPFFIALDGTWHRPLTTFELAILQGFPRYMPDGRPLNLVGRSDAAKRERIGNAVPPPAACAAARVMGTTLLLGERREFHFGQGTVIWVSPGGRPVQSPFESMEPQPESGTSQVGASPAEA